MATSSPRTSRATELEVTPEQRFIRAFHLAAVQAGAVARRLQGEVQPRRKNGHATETGAAVTAVDLAAQDVILHALHAVLPNAAVDAEEETDTVGLFAPTQAGRPLLVVDPVDGSLNYIRGSDDYAVMGALIGDGEYRSALVHFPVHECTYWARSGEGCYRQELSRDAVPAHVARAPKSILVSPGVPKTWRQTLHEEGYAVVESHCSAVDALAPVLGRAEAAVAHGRVSRRRAIGYLIASEAGGTVRLGRRVWRGEDPDTVEDIAGAAIVAVSSSSSDRIHELLQQHHSR